MSLLENDHCNSLQRRQVRAMSILQFPDSFINLLEPFKNVFTHPSFKLFQVILLGILANPSRKSITAAYVLMGFTGHFSNLHRFVSRYRWDRQQFSLQLLTLIIKTLSLDKEPLVFALDDTLVPKYGRKIHGRSTHYDHCAKVNRPQYIQGLNWVVMALVHYVSPFHKWIALPFLSQLYITRDKLGESQEFKTRIQIAQDMVASLKRTLPNPLTLVTDALFATRGLIRCCFREGVTFISRLQCNAALFLPAPPRKRKARGRPKKYGSRLPSLARLAQSSKGFRTYSLVLYGKTRDVPVKTVKAYWKPAGCVVLVLIVRYPGKKSPTFFFCTDEHLSVERVLTLVAARWGIENTFKDMKQHLGLEDWQCRVKNAVERSATITCAAFTLLTLWSLQQVNRKQPELWDPLPWYNQKTTVSLLDMKCQLRNQLITQNIFAVLGSTPMNRKIKQRLSAILKMAA